MTTTHHLNAPALSETKGFLTPVVVTVVDSRKKLERNSHEQQQEQQDEERPSAAAPDAHPLLVDKLKQHPGVRTQDELDDGGLKEEEEEERKVVNATTTTTASPSQQQPPVQKSILETARTFLKSFGASPAVGNDSSSDKESLSERLPLLLVLVPN